MKRTTTALAVAIALLGVGLGVGCGGETDAPVDAIGSPDSPSSTASNGANPIAATTDFARCDPDADFPRAPEEWYRDRPRYVGNEQPTEQVRAWAQTQPGFETIWIDRDHNGWVAVGFSQDVEARQRDIEERFPDDGVVAVAIGWRDSELRQLQGRVSQAMAAAGLRSGTVGVNRVGQVAVDVGLLTEQNVAWLDQFSGEPICVDGRDPAGAITGPQQDQGPGWRLLVLSGSSNARRAAQGAQIPEPEPDPALPPATPGGLVLGSRLEIATDQAQLATMWAAVKAEAAAGLSPLGPAPEVDFSKEVVVLGHEVESGSCPILLTGVTVDHQSGVVTVNTAVPDTYVVCNSDANPVTYAIAIDRGVLPAGPFLLSGLSGVAELWVDVDLTTPGAAVDPFATLARPEGLGTRPGFEADTRPTAPPGPNPTAMSAPAPVFPTFIETGFDWPLDLPYGCVGSLGPLNEYMWGPEDPELAGSPPDDWLVVADPETQRIPVVLLLTVPDGADPVLDVSANGRTERYTISVPAGDGPGC